MWAGEEGVYLSAELPEAAGWYVDVSVHDGRVMIQGVPEVITNDPEARRVYLGESFSV